LVDSARLTDSIRGEVLAPGDSGFEEARSLWNVRFDRKPDLIARCTSHDDVVEAVAYARDEGVELSVKCGGHNYAAKTVAEGGLLIDLSPMKSIEVDLEAETVRIGAGVTGAELDAATQQHGLGRSSSYGLLSWRGRCGPRWWNGLSVEKVWDHR
jgi:FAD/FMN-containing dehydrogenase